MANIKILGEHSVDTDLLTGGVCIDVGCRGFEFSKWMFSLGCHVWAFDLEEMEVPPLAKMTGPTRFEFIQAAVTVDGRTVKYVDTKDPQAKYLNDDRGTVEVWSESIYSLYRRLEGANLDILKLDCEGHEYFLLSDKDFVPKARQISVEFHMHCHRALHDQYYDKCMEHLLKYYEPVKHELTQAHGAGWNYWDSLFIRRDLL